MKPFYKAAIQLSLAACIAQSTTFCQPPTINFQAVITGLSAPVDIVSAGDGSNRLFVVQQNGLIKVWNGTALSDFMNVASTITTGGERGLLSMVFHPDFNGTSNRFFFLYYTNTNGDIEVSRFQTNPGNSNTGDAVSKVVIITIPHPTNSNHNGGKLNFGTDGYLYFATGDGGGANDVPNNAQNGNVLLGKMIRIDINTLTPQTFGQYTIPADNPYVVDASVRDEIWALGLRNPFRWNFDRANGNMWIGDVGQAAKEEINFRPAGSTGHVNYGWRCFEGTISTPNVDDCTPADNVFPVFDYDNPGSSPSAVTGGYVYRGDEFASLRGYYIATDFYSGTLYLLWPNGSGGFNSSTQTTGVQNFISAFGESDNGALYAASQATNTVYKLIAVGGAPLPVKLKNFSVQRHNNYNDLKWSTAFEQGTSKFHIEYSIDGNHFLRTGTITALQNPDGSNYIYQHYFSGNGYVLYRLAIEESNGRINYSSILRIAWSNEKASSVYPTVITNNILNLSSSIPVGRLQLLNSNGTIVFEKHLNNLTGAVAINLPALPKGIYLVQMITNGKASTSKILIR